MEIIGKHGKTVQEQIRTNPRNPIKYYQIPVDSGREGEISGYRNKCL